VSGSPKGRKLIPLFEGQIGKDPRIDRVVIAALWPLYFKNNNNPNTMDGVPMTETKAQERALQALGELIGRNVALGKKVTLVLGIPTGSELDPRFAIERSFFVVSSRKPSPLKKEAFQKATLSITEKIKTTALSHGAEVIAPVDFLTVNGVCIFENEEGPIRYNGSHLRPGYVREYLKYLDGTVAP